MNLEIIGVSLVPNSLQGYEIPNKILSIKKFKVHIYKNTQA